jgi:hypothetical protein
VVAALTTAEHSPSRFGQFLIGRWSHEPKTKCEAKGAKAKVINT